VVDRLCFAQFTCEEGGKQLEAGEWLVFPPMAPFQVLRTTDVAYHVVPWRDFIVAPQRSLQPSPDE
jgi:hypothetical protein